MGACCETVGIEISLRVEPVLPIEDVLDCGVDRDPRFLTARVLNLLPSAAFRRRCAAAPMNLESVVTG